MKKFFNFFTERREAQKGPPVARPRTDESLFALGPNRIDIKSSSRRLAPLNKAPQENIYDCLGFVIHCPKHNSMAVCESQHIGGTSAVWLPFIYLSPTIGWGEAINDGLALILSDNETALLQQLKTKQPWEVCIMDILRIQLPHTQRYITRLISLARLNNKSKDIQCCRKTSRISWIKLDAIKTVDNVWGQELRHYSRKVGVDMTDSDSYQTELEHDLEWVLKYVPRDPPRNQEEDMLRHLNISEKHIERVFIDFLEHSFPAYLMSFHSFKNYFRKYGIVWDDSRVAQFFTAFNYSENGYISYHELLLGMACIEPDVFNGESRWKFIFRFYDKDKDVLLNETEFRSLVTDIDNSVSNEVLNEKVRQGMKVMKATPNGIAFKDFSAAINSHKFRGTSNVCRSQRSIFRAILNVMASRGVKANPELKKTVAEYLNKKVYEGNCDNCKKVVYEVAAHSVEFGIDGKASNYQLIPELTDVIKKQLLTPQKNPYLSEQYSIDVTFNTSHLANILRQQIQAFNAVKGTREQPKGLLADTNANRQSFVKMLGQLADDIIPILESEDRCVKVSSPAVVVGDIHGNLEDLMSIEKCLFKTAPVVTSNYVFLGDYVDRGKWSVECAVYLMCLKVLAPVNFVLLRGNHETRVMTETYSFKREVKWKYQSFGSAVYETFHRIFDHLPVAAVIDDSIFCAHGGIPASTSAIKEIDKIKNRLQNVEQESPIAWEMMWNDPVDKKEFKQTVDMLRKRVDISRGFVHNQRRGTAFYFSDFACQDFLKSNGLSHIIRAHEVPTLGFRFHFDQKCVTIFSCSHYMGKDNKAAVVFIVDQTLRIVELDTTNNPPATDDPENRNRE